MKNYYGMIKKHTIEYNLLLTYLLLVIKNVLHYSFHKKNEINNQFCLFHSVLQHLPLKSSTVCGFRHFLKVKTKSANIIYCRNMK